MIQKLALAAVSLSLAFTVPTCVVQLDGDGDFVLIEDSPTLSQLEEVSVQAWIHPSSLAGTSNGIEDIVAQYHSLLMLNAYFIGYVRTSGKMRVYVNPNSNGGGFDGEIDIPQDAWTHVALTYDGATLKLYVNGVLDGEETFEPEPVRDIDVPIIIGAQASGKSNQFRGLIDEVSIWNRALLPSEIKAGMNSFPSAGSPGLVGAWDFDSRGKLVFDKSENGNHGKLIGDAAKALWPLQNPIQILAPR